MRRRTFRVMRRAGATGGIARSGTDARGVPFAGIDKGRFTMEQAGKDRAAAGTGSDELQRASRVVNEPRIKNPLIRAIRELLEHRALWLHLLADEAKRAGADPSVFAPAAVKRCGLFQGAELVAKGGGTHSLKSLKKGLFGKPAQMVFEMDVKDVQDDRFELEFHYCPLVKAWQKQGCTDEEISDLCDWAMCGDRGIGEAYGCKLDLPKTIARGDDVCHLVYHREK